MSAPVLSWLFTVQGTSEDTSPVSPRRAQVHYPPGGVSSTWLSSDSRQIPTPSPQSQSFSRSYGSILPTSLTYIVLSTRGCSPWRPDAVMGTTRGANNLSLGFSRAVASAPDTVKHGAFPAVEPYLRAIRFQGSRLLKRKDNSSRGPRRRLRVHLCYHTVSTSWLGNINPIPFRGARQSLRRRSFPTA